MKLKQLREELMKNSYIKTPGKRNWNNLIRSQDICYCLLTMIHLTLSILTKMILSELGLFFSTSEANLLILNYIKNLAQLLFGIAQTNLKVTSFLGNFTTWCFNSPIKEDIKFKHHKLAKKQAGQLI